MGGRAGVWSSARSLSGQKERGQGCTVCGCWFRKHRLHIWSRYQGGRPFPCGLLPWAAHLCAEILASLQPVTYLGRVSKSQNGSLSLTGLRVRRGAGVVGGAGRQAGGAQRQFLVRGTVLKCTRAGKPGGLGREVPRAREQPTRRSARGCGVGRASPGAGAPCRRARWRALLAAGGQGGRSALRCRGEKARPGDNLRRWPCSPVRWSVRWASQEALALFSQESRAVGASARVAPCHGTAAHGGGLSTLLRALV